MRYLLFGIFLGVPIVEIALFILVGQHIGLLPTLAAIVLTALAGAALVRHQGLATLAQARRQIEHDRLPVGELGEGLAILLAGALLLTPGFLTDAIGFTLLVPPARRYLVGFVRQRLAPHVIVNGFGGGRRERRDGGPVIEGEAVEIEEESRPQSDPERSPWRER